VLLLCDTSAEWAALSLAVQACGGMLVAVPPTLSTEQVQEVTLQTAPVLAFVEDKGQLKKVLSRNEASSAVRSIVCMHCDGVRSSSSAASISWNAFVESGEADTFSADFQRSLSELRLEVNYGGGRFGCLLLSCSHWS
jgi:long-subunit acyl-CoA synthetase (AMP-forming)